MLSQSLENFQLAVHIYIAQELSLNLATPGYNIDQSGDNTKSYSRLASIEPQ